MDNSCIAVSGCVSYNMLPKWEINNTPRDNFYINNYTGYVSKPKTFLERLEDEITNWHGNILQEIKAYG